VLIGPTGAALTAASWPKMRSSEAPPVAILAATRKPRIRGFGFPFRDLES